MEIIEKHQKCDLKKNFGIHVCIPNMIIHDKIWSYIIEIAQSWNTNTYSFYLHQIRCQLKFDAK